MNETAVLESHQHTVDVWQGDGVRWEQHRYGPGPAGSHPRHAHDVYQIGYSPDFDGEYWYRGEHVAVPQGSLHVVHPGEVHAPRDPRPRPTTVHFPTAYVHPSLLLAACADTQRSDSSLPFLPLVIRDADLVAQFVALLPAVSGPGDSLQRTSLLRSFLGGLVERYTHGAAPVGGHEHDAVHKVRTYVHAHFRDSLTLEQLAEVADLNPYYLSRVFRKDVGIPPYRYVTQLRVQEAAKRLARGDDIATVAFATGFSDQPHLTRHFKRIVGVTPGAYRGRASAPK
jgi:AraC-like DNA-binding protein